VSQKTTEATAGFSDPPVEDHLLHTTGKALNFLTSVNPVECQIHSPRRKSLKYKAAKDEAEHLFFYLSPVFSLCASVYTFWH